MTEKQPKTVLLVDMPESTPEEISPSDHERLKAFIAGSQHIPGSARDIVRLIEADESSGVPLNEP